MNSILERPIATEKAEEGSKIINIIAYFYITIPFVIFILGWIGLRYSIPCTILIGISMYQIIKNSPKIWKPEFNQDNIVKIICIIIFVLIWVYFSGIGKYVFQNTDHGARNTIFNILVQYDWPVINYELYPENEAYGPTSLIYYIGFWMPAALVGKIFGINAGYGFQVFWAVIGILLFYYFVCAKMKKITLWPLAVFVFFSGLDIVGHFLIGTNLFTLENDLHLEWWGGVYQYSSITTQLFWVFNQAIPAWLCTIMVLSQKDNRSRVYIAACCMLHATFPFIGLLALILFLAITRLYDILKISDGEKKIQVLYWFKEIFTFENVIGGGIIGILSFGYLMGNLSGTHIMQESTMGPNMNNSLFKYIVFILLEVGVYFFALYKYNKKNRLYYFIIICLLIIPPIKIGNSSDFCMRVSIPFLVILYLFIIDTLKIAYEKKNKGILMGLLIILIIGSMTPIHEFTRTVKNTFISINNGEKPYLQSENEEAYITAILNSENFSGSIQDNWFYKYIIK